MIGSAFTNPSRSRSTGSIAPRKLVKQPSKQVSAFDRWKPPEPLAYSTRGMFNGNAVTKVFRRLSRGSTPSRPMSGDNSSTVSLISDSEVSSECHASSPPLESDATGSPPPTFRHFNSEELPCDTTLQHELYPRDSRRYLSCIEANRSREPSRIFSFRDLAILPTQRVMRYVLLFRGADSLSNRVGIPMSYRVSTDLLAYTPETCCNRQVIEQALETARRIAEKCNGAQRNTAFARCN